MSTQPVSRAGAKLAAAIERFGLGGRIRGAQAVDVGASTGGFTEALLAHGAAHVLAVDVGHGQLHQRLRDDARVESLEGADWKTLSLGQAPGPFDFFTVDVSFVAARNMLRGLAFRLRSGAEGVVLVKPQFELPERKAGAALDDAGWRARALARFTAKAVELGFAVVAHADSPVAGGGGTVEVLAHLRFSGRTAKLPEFKDGRVPLVLSPKSRSRRVVSLAGEALTWFAVAAPGLESVTHAEVARLPGVGAATLAEGGVEFTGLLAVGMAANLHLRTATRVLLRLGQVRAREFGKLRHLLAKLAWRACVAPDRPLVITASATRCRLYHTGAIGETVDLAVQDAVGALPPRPPRAGVDDGGEAGDATEEPAVAPAATRVLLRGAGDRWTVSVDCSGELLHRRGYRVETGRAPLRETLAAGILALAGYDGGVALVDPMCGSGTLALEACAVALDAAPGLERHFAFEHWPAFDATAARAWDELRATARGRVRPAPPAPIVACDRDAAAVAIAQRNATRAGWQAHVQIEQFAARDAPVPPAPGLVVLNPPYGRRLGPHTGPGPWRDLGRLLRTRFSGFRAAVLAPSPAAAQALGLRPQATHTLAHGGLRVQLLVIDIP